jgi:glycosyltransferase involved in cell wall biosynthesis
VKHKQARICLITPGHLSTNPRLVKEADALSHAGYDVIVIAANYMPWAHRLDEGFASRGWRAAPAQAFGPRAPRARRVRQLLRHAAARWLFRRGVRQCEMARAAVHQVAPDLAVAATAVDADLYIAHYPAALPAAAAAARRLAVSYAFDAEDFHLGELGAGSRDEQSRRVIASIEGAYLSGCAYITAASPGIATAYAETYGLAPPTVVLNVFSREEAPCAPTARGSAVPGPSVYWFSQTIGPNRGLEIAVRAIARSSARPHLYLRGTPAAGYRERLEALARDAKVFDRLHFLAPGLPHEMVRMSAAFDVGLVGETAYTKNSDILLSNKQFTYLLAGVPALMSDTWAHRMFASGRDAGVVLFPGQDPAGLAIAMDRLLGDPATLSRARAAAYRLGQDVFNWDLEQKILLERVEWALSTHRAREG